jgi:hypothetical protein
MRTLNLRGYVFRTVAPRPKLQRPSTYHRPRTERVEAEKCGHSASVRKIGIEEHAGPYQSVRSVRGVEMAGTTVWRKLDSRRTPGNAQYSRVLSRWGDASVLAFLSRALVSMTRFAGHLPTSFRFPSTRPCGS